MDNLDYLVECNFTCSLDTIDPRYTSHTKYELFLLLEGHASMLINSERYQLTRGSLVLLTCDDVHLSINNSEVPYRRVTMHFNPQIIQMYNTERTNLLACFATAKKENRHIIQLTEEKTAQYLDTAQKIAGLWGSSAYGDDLTAITLLIQHLIFLNRIYRRKADAKPLKASPIVRQIIHYVDKHIGEPITVGMLAAQYAYSESRISTMFSSEMGVPLRRYIIVRKIIYAQNLLREGCTVEQACSGAGFNDYCNFIRTFKNVAGLSPRQWQWQLTTREERNHG